VSRERERGEKRDALENGGGHGVREPKKNEKEEERGREDSRLRDRKSREDRAETA